MKRILAIDDDQDILKILRIYLRHDYQIATVSSGAEAFDYLSKNDLPDLILLDIDMPGMNGFEFSKKLKNDPRLNHISVIFISANTYHADNMELKSPLHFLNKPIAREDLLFILETHFNYPTK